MITWLGYEFSDAELNFWAEELCTAARELAAEKRPAFLTVACRGSDRLKDRVESLLEKANDWSSSSVGQGGLCHPGDVVQDCLVLYIVGQGAAAEVYKAIQVSLRRIVAIKIIKNPEHRELLETEAVRASQLKHENIATVHSANLQGDRPSVVMEYVDGQSLREWLRQHEPDDGISHELVYSIVKQVALALRAAHSRGIIHRDIKPENILVHVDRDNQWRAKVVDFGIAGVADTALRTVAGTPGYISPEQFDGIPADQRADIFSLGVVLYEMLTGEHPFKGKNELEIYYNTRNSEPPPLSAEIAHKYADVLKKTLHKSPDQRYSRIEEFIADLDRTEEDQPGTSPKRSFPLFSELPEPIRNWVGRHNYGFAVSATSLVLGFLTILLSIFARAACLRVRWEPERSAAFFEMTYGFVTEPNAGFWYMFGAPLCILAGFGLLQAAHIGLANTKTLAVYNGGRADPNASPLDWIADRNRHYFRFLTPLIILLGCGIVLIPELIARDGSAFGWVQADLADRFKDSDYWTLKSQNRVSEIPAVERLCSKCPTKAVSVTNYGNGFSPPSPAIFYSFLAIALGHQILLSAFFAWIAFKIVFIFGLLSKALIGSGENGLRLEPDFEDSTDYRLGLGRLDNLYNAILLVALLASSGFLLQVIANLNKGTYFFSGRPAVQLIGQLVTLAAVAVIITLTVFCPTVMFLFLTVRAKSEELARLSENRNRLEKKLRALDSSARRALEEQMERLQRRRETVHRQSLLPFKNRAFRWLLLVSFLLLVIAPVAVSWLDLPGGGTVSKVLNKLNSLLCGVCGNSPS